jgi:hypothetical protein
MTKTTNNKKGAPPKPLTKEVLLSAMEKTKSVKAMTRYLHCSYPHVKMWMKHYKDEATGKTLFELHKNQCGKGIPKHLSSHPNRKAEPSLQGIVEGRISAAHFDPQKIKIRLIEQNYLEEKCYKCGFHERRVTDYKMPLFLHFKNGDHNYYHLDNLQMLCYNCYFLFVGEIFSDRDEKQIETGTKMSKTTENVNFELDEYHVRRLRELGLYEDRTEDDPYSLVSRR